MKKSKIFDSGFSDWTPKQLPDLTGKTFLITGGNSGVGLEAAKILAKANANTIIACRNPTKAKQAVTEIATLGFGNAESVQLDLASMESVRSAATEVRTRYAKLDGLINNAGIMAPPQTKTVDGFELQLATNHLGHFLFASLLLDILEKSSGRIVVVSSIVHKSGDINFDDLMLNKSYSPSKAYNQAKLANLMFALELDRKLKTSGSSVSCVACHPGFSATKLQSTGPKGPMKLVFKTLSFLMAQSPDKGAIPTVLSAAGVEALPGAYYGPQSMDEARGKVSDAIVAEQAQNQKAAARLWLESEKLVKQKWSFCS